MTDEERMLHKLHKKLKGVQDLKAKLEANGGVPNEAQTVKLAGEAELLEKIAKLTVDS